MQATATQVVKLLCSCRRAFLCFAHGLLLEQFRWRVWLGLHLVFAYADVSLDVSDGSIVAPAC